MSNDFYVYLHKKRTNGEIFYIGKGSGRRCFVKNGRSNHWKNIVNKHGYIIEIINNNLSERESLDIEIDLIKKFKPVCNLTNGGDGAKGFEVNDLTREKYRAAKLGKKQSDAHAKKSAIARLGKKNKPESTEKTIAPKRKKIINSDGVCFKSSCSAAEYMTKKLGKKCYQGIISMAANGVRNNAYGVTWSYNLSSIPLFKKTKLNNKRVKLIEKNIIFDSVCSATEYLIKTIGRGKHQGISASARSFGVICAYGFHWSYLKD
jgi:hypothetical protein